MNCSNDNRAACLYFRFLLTHLFYFVSSYYFFPFLFCCETLSSGGLEYFPGVSRYQSSSGTPCWLARNVNCKGRVDVCPITCMRYQWAQGCPCLCCPCSPLCCCCRSEAGIGGVNLTACHTARKGTYIHAPGSCWHPPLWLPELPRLNLAKLCSSFLHHTSTCGISVSISSAQIDCLVFADDWMLCLCCLRCISLSINPSVSHGTAAAQGDALQKCWGYWAGES